jgi:hypothetical protein
MNGGNKHADYDKLIREKKDLEHQLKQIKKQIDTHPITVQRNIEKGINRFIQLSNVDKTDKVISKTLKSKLINYEEQIVRNSIGLQPDKDYAYIYHLKGGWRITISLEFRPANENYEIMITIKCGDYMASYDPDNLSYKYSNLDPRRGQDEAFGDFVRTFKKCSEYKKYLPIIRILKVICENDLFEIYSS